MNTQRLALMQDFLSLAKPKVVALVMLTAAVGAAMAMMQNGGDPTASLLALAGVALVASAAAAFNCMVEIVADGAMRRTKSRPLPAGRLRSEQAAAFVAIIGGVGMSLTTIFGGTLAGALTAATFFGYAVVYTLLLKRRTPQNIVIGGAAGAMPPLLGWVIVTGEFGFEPALLFLIVFVWTPPHFWALALWRRDDYAKAGIPMLPVTHGEVFTAMQIALYGVMLFVVSLLPFASGMAGWVYLIAAAPLSGRFLWLSWRLWRGLAAADGKRLFSYSVFYLAALFAALLADAALATVAL